MLACSQMTNQKQTRPRNEITLLVDNRNWSDAKVYAITGAGERRIATVTSLSQQTVKVALDNSGEFSVQVRFIGSTARWYVQPILVSPGDLVKLTIANTESFTNLIRDDS